MEHFLQEINKLLQHILRDGTISECPNAYILKKITSGYFTYIHSKMKDRE